MRERRYCTDDYALQLSLHMQETDVTKQYLAERHRQRTVNVWHFRVVSLRNGIRPIKYCRYGLSYSGHVLWFNDGASRPLLARSSLAPRRPRDNTLSTHAHYLKSFSDQISETEIAVTIKLHYRHRHAILRLGT